MKIAQVAPLHESVPPRGYGGTERVVHYLTEELVRQGHEVTLFASGDSKTSADLEVGCPRALRTDPNCQTTLVHHVLQAERVFQRAADFDLIHFHTDYLHFPLLRKTNVRSLTTFHWRLDLPDFTPIAREFAEVPVASISRNQRRALPFLNWRGTVYHGLPRNSYSPHPAPGSYLAFLGRMSPEKGPVEAMEIARRTGIPLKMAAKVNDFEQEYFEETIKPLLRDPLVEFIGEISESDKNEFLGNALALVFPIKWPEPFGLVMTEALACGTPVVAFGCGSVPEVIDHGRTGFIVENVDQAVAAVERIADIDRRVCRAVFETRFSAERMASDYLGLYRTLQSRMRTRNEEQPWKRSSRLPVNTTSLPLPRWLTTDAAS